MLSVNTSVYLNIVYLHGTKMYHVTSNNCRLQTFTRLGFGNQCCYNGTIFPKSADCTVTTFSLAIVKP